MGEQYSMAATAGNRTPRALTRLPHIRRDMAQVYPRKAPLENTEDPVFVALLDRYGKTVAASYRRLLFRNTKRKVLVPWLASNTVDSIPVTTRRAPTIHPRLRRPSSPFV